MVFSSQPSSSSSQSSTDSGIGGSRDSPPAELYFISKNELERFDIRRTRRLIYEFKQQNFDLQMRLSSSMRRYNGVILLVVWGVLLLSLGTALIGFSSGSTFLNIPYDDTTDYIDVNMTHVVQGPLFFYVQITGMHVNTRRYVLSRPEDYFRGYSCGSFVSLESAYTIRPKESIPELDSYSNGSSLFPCGAGSFAYFNDEYEIYYKPIHNETEISAERIYGDEAAPAETFCLYTRITDPNRTANFWTQPVEDYRYQSWMYSSFNSRFLIYLGVFQSYQLYEGIYRINVTKNLWPASHFNAQKSIAILTLSRIGSDQYPLGVVLCFAGTIVILVSIVFLVGIKKNFSVLSDNFTDAMSNGVREELAVHMRQFVRQQNTRKAMPSHTHGSVSMRWHPSRLKTEDDDKEVDEFDTNSGDGLDPFERPEDLFVLPKEVARPMNSQINEIRHQDSVWDEESLSDTVENNSTTTREKRLDKLDESVSLELQTRRSGLRYFDEREYKIFELPSPWSP